MSFTSACTTSSLPTQERDPPAGHREALGHRVQLDGALLRALGLQDRGRHVAVEADVGVGEIVHRDHLALAAEVDDALHERNVDARARGVVRERDHEHPRLRPADVVGLVEALERVDAGRHRDLPQVGAGEERAVDVDRVARARHDRRVARLQERPHQVREPLLRADRVRDLRLGVELDAEAAQVQRGDRLAHARDAARQRVAVVARQAGRLGELLDRDLGRGDVGIAEAEVDDVDAAPARVDLELVDDLEDVGREAGDAPELHLGPIVATVASRP